MKGFKLFIIVVGVLFAAGTIVAAFFWRDLLKQSPFHTSLTFENLNQAVTGEDGSLLVLDRGTRRLTILSGHQVTSIIHGGKRTGGFFYAAHMASGNGKIYIADIRYAEGNTQVEAERILQFSSDGLFEKVLFEHIYQENRPLQYGNILDLNIRDNQITFLMQQGNRLNLFSLTAEGATLLRSISTPHASFLHNASYNVHADRVYAVGKDGRLYGEGSQSELLLLKDGLKDKTGNAGVPWELISDDSGAFYITDLIRPGIIQSNGQTFFESGSIIYNLDVCSDGILSFSDQQQVYQLNREGTVLFSANTVPYSREYFVQSLAIWLSVAVAFILLLYMALRLCMWLARENHGGAKYLLPLLLSTVLTFSIVAAGFVQMLLDHHTTAKKNSLTQVALSLSGTSGTTFGNDFAALDSLDDYRTPAYNRVRGWIDPICRSSQELGEYMYFLLYKMVDGKLCAVMDYEDTINVIYPMGDYPVAYDQVRNGSLSYYHESGSDSYGSWIYTVVPVYDSEGTITGLLEMGSNLDVETQRVRAQIQDVILSTTVLLLLLILMFTEAAAVMEPLSHVRRRRGACFRRFSNCPEWIRMVTFLAFLAANTNAAFIPQLSEKLFVSSGLRFSNSLGAALPLSAHLFMTALAAPVSGLLIDRLGMKVVLLGGILTEVVGLLLTAAAAAAESYLLLLLAFGLAGCGLGVVVVSGNILPSAIQEERKRNDLFAGVNVGTASGVVMGTAIGSYAAQSWGYAVTFTLSAILLLPALWFGLRCTSQMSLTHQEVHAVKTGIGTFMRQKGVFSFLLFVMFPFLTTLYFRQFVFPLYADELGYSEIGIGQVLFFSGALSIFMAPSLSGFLLRTLRVKGTNLLSGGLFAASLIFFSVAPSLTSAIVVVYLLNMVGCIGLVAQSIYFSTLKSSHRLGVGKAMGIYSLFDSLSQTAGPLLFGAVLVWGYQTAAMAIGLISAVLLGLFVWMGEADQSVR